MTLVLLNSIFTILWFSKTMHVSGTSTTCIKGDIHYSRIVGPRTYLSVDVVGHYDNGHVYKCRVEFVNCRLNSIHVNGAMSQWPPMSNAKCSRTTFLLQCLSQLVCVEPIPKTHSILPSLKYNEGWIFNWIILNYEYMITTINFKKISVCSTMLVEWLKNVYANSCLSVNNAKINNTNIFNGKCCFEWYWQ